ncbi:MAG: NigD-like protein [Petrimonas sp.]|uniref:NigD-like protein n=1 Tax=Petrimonas sp. TaxID=2023866 RepID=UPI002B3BB62C|nr:NigD-like protein [Petrimonas sp.]MEA4978502.1 NigD-like protein [Petrimonas sp.]MEA5043627.1 NigD-like protein [Petrimonas sp.]MEA5062223.1 NigD-like protein [Petrimonas sp.]
MKITRFLLTTGMLMGFLLFPSCLDDNTDRDLLYPNALVTVKHAGDETVFLQLDDKTTLLPVNLKSSLFDKKEVRALVNYKEVDDPSKEYDQAVYVNWIDSIRTKPMAPDLGSGNTEAYGDDPVEIVSDWVTIAEDGYLTLRFRTRWGYQQTIHYVNLIPTNNPDNPYEVEFRHNANGDTAERVGDGLVAFRLDKLPDTKGETVKLKLKWKSFSGDKTAEFDYKTRAATPAGSAIASERSVLPLQ